MKAIVQDRYGSPDVVQLREVDTPVVGDDEVRMHAAGVDKASGTSWRACLRDPPRGLRDPRAEEPRSGCRPGIVEAVGAGSETGGYAADSNRRPPPYHSQAVLAYTAGHLRSPSFCKSGP